ncbi:hypothetical protein BaRGS_00035607, partial [Batillaria attramentaria]
MSASDHRKMEGKYRIVCSRRFALLSAFPHSRKPAASPDTIVTAAASVHILPPDWGTVTPRGVLVEARLPPAAIAVSNRVPERAESGLELEGIHARSKSQGNCLKNHPDSVVGSSTLGERGRVSILLPLFAISRAPREIEQSGEKISASRQLIPCLVYK